MKKISVVALLALTAVPVCGQDLLARQAPVDHRMKALDTLAVSHYRLMEDRENPAAELCKLYLSACKCHHQCVNCFCGRIVDFICIP